jgi:6-phosphogluconolactonase (cycloisomerase 2 family)
VANWTSGDVSAYTIGQTPGALTSVGAAVSAGTWPESVTIDPSGKFAYVANYNSNDVSAYTIDQTTGALTSVGTAIAAGTWPYSVVVSGSIE